MGLEEIKKKFIKEYIRLYNVLHKMDNNEKEISASIRFLGRLKFYYGAAASRYNS